MNKCVELVAQASFAVAIVGNPGTRDFELLDLPVKASLVLRDELKRRLEFCGIIALVGGRPQTALESPLDESVITALTHAFLDRIDAALTITEAVLAARTDAPPSDWLKFAESLWALPDPRPEL